MPGTISCVWHEPAGCDFASHCLQSLEDPRDDVVVNLVNPLRSSALCSEIPLALPPFLRNLQASFFLPGVQLLCFARMPEERIRGIRGQVLKISLASFCHACVNELHWTC